METMYVGKYSFQTGIKKAFHAADYAVTACVLGLSAAIGLFYAVKDRKRSTTDNYLLAGRGMHPVPVALSMVSSFISAITLLGTPAEVYINGTMYWWIAVSFIITALGAGHIFIPIFYNLGITSIFQYTEMRFGRIVRILATTIYLIWMMLYIGLVLYAPSLALNAVTGLPMWGSVVVVSLVCTFYTALGGMKAVLWADTFQMLIIYTGMVTIVIKGYLEVGGFDRAWRIADEGGRIQMFEFDTDPTVRHSVWNLVIGGGIFWCTIYGTNQAQVQRAISVRSVTRAKVAIWLSLPGFAAITILVCLCGVVMYALYSTCDPVKFGLISKPDQLLPLYMMDLLGEQKGLPGLLLSCIFSGSLSSISSGLNAIAAVMLEDYVKPLCCKKIPEARATRLTKTIVVLFGLLGLAFAFVIAQLDAMVIQLVYSLFGVLGGPMLGLFTLGMLFPWANKWGGGIGLITSLACLLWIGIGSKISKTSTAVKLGVTTEGCNWNISGSAMSGVGNITTVTAATVLGTATTAVYDRYSGIQRLYTISYIWYATLGVLVTVFIGMAVSLVTGRTDPKSLNPKLICPVFDVFFPYLPEKLRKPLRFGVRHRTDVDGGTLEEEERKKMLRNIIKKTEFIGESALDTENVPFSLQTMAH